MLRVNKCSKAISYIKTIFLYRRYFFSIGKMSIIESPMLFSDTRSVCIGEHTYIAHFAWLMGDKKSDEITLNIGNNVQIGHFAHIVGKYSVTIMDSVLIADRVYISDCDHNFENTDIPILDQGIHYIGNVVIGEGSWIGENVCVSGANIGKHCVIAANSVVKDDIPDYSIAAGMPARVVKKYDFERGEWVKVT